jgi:hypothetical protein
MRERIKLKKFCLIFGNEIERIRLNLRPEKRNRKILAFAKVNQWEATIRDPGIRVTFKPLEP